VWIRKTGGLLWTLHINMAIAFISQVSQPVGGLTTTSGGEHIKKPHLLSRQHRDLADSSGLGMHYYSFGVNNARVARRAGGDANAGAVWQGI
jgi:hypothetical protein